MITQFHFNLKELKLQKTALEIENKSFLTRASFIYLNQFMQFALNQVSITSFSQQNMVHYSTFFETQDFSAYDNLSCFMFQVYFSNLWPYET